MKDIPIFFIIIFPLILLGIGILFKLLEKKFFPFSDKMRIIDAHAPQPPQHKDIYLRYKRSVRVTLFFGIISSLLLLYAYHDIENTDKMILLCISDLIAFGGAVIVFVVFILPGFITYLISNPKKVQVRVMKEIFMKKRPETYMFTISDCSGETSVLNRCRDLVHYPVIFSVMIFFLAVTIIFGTEKGMPVAGVISMIIFVADYFIIRSAQNELVKEAFPERIKNFKLDIQWRLAYIELAQKYGFCVRKISEEEWIRIYRTMVTGGRRSIIPGAYFTMEIYKDNPVFLEEFRKILIQAKEVYDAKYQKRN